MENSKQRQVYELFIQTSPATLWHSLTNGELTPNYFFGVLADGQAARLAPAWLTGKSGALIM